MIIKPVYLVEPEPDRRPSRRTFVLTAIGCFVGGAAAGAGTGYALATPHEEAPRKDSAADRRLRRAIELAEGPTSELLRHFNEYAIAFSENPGHATLERALEPLAQYVLESTSPSDSWQVATRVDHMLRRSDRGPASLRAKLQAFADQR